MQFEFISAWSAAIRKRPYSAFLVFLTGAFLGVGIHLQLRWWIWAFIFGPRLILFPQLGLIAFSLFEWGIILLRRHLTGRPPEELLRSEAWSSLPLALPVMILLEPFMPIENYAKLVWTVSLVLAGVLKGAVLLSNVMRWRRLKNEPAISRTSDAPLSKRSAGRDWGAHTVLVALAMVLAVLIKLPLILAWPVGLIFWRVFVSFEGILIFLYLIRWAGRKVAGSGGEKAAPLILLAILAVIFLTYRNRDQSLWKTVSSLPPVLTKPLFADSDGVLVRRVSIQGQTRDAVVSSLPATGSSRNLYEKLPGEIPYTVYISMGVICLRPVAAHGARFALSIEGKEIWNDDVTCPIFAFRENWHVKAAENARGSLQLKITPLPGTSSDDAMAVVAAHANPDSVMPGISPRRPNVLILLVDALRADHLGTYGYSLRNTSPRINGLGREGTVFERAISQASFTAPSVASLLTGLYPGHHHVDSIASFTLPDSVITLAERFRKAGYTTAGFAGTVVLTDFLKITNRFETFDRHCVNKMNFLSGECMAGQIIPWIAENVRRPFFIYAHLYDPHDPYNAPAPYGNMFCDMSPDHSKLIGGDVTQITRGFLINFPAMALTPKDIEYLKCRYDGEIRYVDEQIGAIADSMKARGLLDNTVLVITADHGEEFTDNGKLKHGQSLYHHQINVPLILRYPPRIPAGRVKAPVQSVDLAPTLLELALLPVPPGMDGRSLVPLLGATEEWSRGLAGSIQASFVDHLTYRSVAVIAGPWKFILTTLPFREELFNIVSDPEEKHNVLSNYPELGRNLEEEAKRFLFGRETPEITRGLSPSVRRSLRALGYIQ